MRILHAGFFQVESVHGTHQALWQLARAQVAAGHEATIVNTGWDVPREDVERAGAEGVRLRGYPAPFWGRIWQDHAGAFGRLLDEARPDVVHLQYVRIPRFLAIERACRARGIPHVVSPHGGYKASEMTRHLWRKLAYWQLVERPIHRRAGGIHFISERERAEYAARFGAPRGASEVVANIVHAPADLPERRHPLNAKAPTLAYFGRYDIFHKGIDLAIELVRRLRARGVAAELHLYGSAAGRFEQAMADLLRRSADVPVVDHGYASHATKYAELVRHDLYVQYSRFEGFGMSVVEAMLCGVPVLASAECDLAPQWGAAGAALIVEMDPALAAEQLLQHLARPEGLEAIGEAGRAWARTHCEPAAVAGRMAGFYERAIGDWRSRGRIA